MASPFDTLLQQVKNKLSSATQFIGGGALQGAQKIQQNFQPQINQNLTRLRNIDLASTIAGGAAKSYLDTRNQPVFSPQRLIAQNLPIVGAVKNVLSQKPTFLSEQVQRAIPGKIGQAAGFLGEVALPGIGGELSAARGIKGLAQTALKSALPGAAYGLSQAETVQDIPQSIARGALFAGTLGTVSRGLTGFRGNVPSIDDVVKEAKSMGIKGISPKAFSMHPEDISEAKALFKKFETGIFSREDFKTVKNLAKGYISNEVSNKTIPEIMRILRYVVSKNEGLDIYKVPKMGIYGGKSATGFKNEGSFSSMADKKVRFEIDDSKARVKSDFAIQRVQDGKRLFRVTDVIDHPELVKQYPELKNTAVVFTDSMTGNRGSYNPKTNTINISSSTKNGEEIKSTLLHEIQHAIQEKEGFARGGSPSGFKTKSIPSNLKDTAFKRDMTEIMLSNKLKAAGFSIGEGKYKTINKPENRAIIEKLAQTDPEVATRLQEFDRHNALLAKYPSAQDQYNRLSGEVEARDVQSRMNLTPEQRASTLPYQSQGIPVKDQIVRFDGGVSASKPSTGGEIGGKAKFKQPIKVPEQPRGFTESVQQAGNIPKRVKGMVQTVYTSKPNTKLMGEAQALLQEGASLDITKVQNVDQKIAATIQEAINQQRKNPDLAANLYNNLARQGTELGRGVQAYSLLQKMTPGAIAKSAAGKIQEYNRTAVRKIPELTGDQLKLITAKVDALKKLPLGSRERNIAVNELSNTVNQFIPSSLADKAITVWKAGLLTSLRTTERNIFGNTVHGAAEAIKDLPATMADMLMSMATGKRTITPTTKGVSEAWSKKTAQQISDTIKLGYDATEDISKFDHKRITWDNTPIQQALKKYTDIVFRSLGAQDKPFYNAAFKRSLFSQAGAEAINVGRGGDRSFIQSLVNKPTEDMIKLAMSDANVATFKDKNMASVAIGKVKKLLEEGFTYEGKLYKSEAARIASEVFMPFTGVPSSILGQIINYSPIGLLKGIVNTGKVIASQVPDLQRQAAQEIGRGVIGTGIFGLGAYLASKGLITGQPKDAEEQRQWDLENKPRNSIMIGGKWRSLNSIGPEAVVFLAGAKLNEEQKNPDGFDIGKYGGTLAKDYLDQSFVQGLQAPINAATDPLRYGKSYLGNLSSSFVPNIVKDLSKATDPYQRETNKVSINPLENDYLKAAIPGKYGRQSLIEKRDVLGNVMPQEPTGLGAFFDLFNSKTPVDNAVVSELSRLQQAGEGATPSKLTPQQTILKEKVKLTFDQLNQLEQGVGEIVRPKLETLINSPVYQQLDDESKAKAIDSIVKDARLKYKNINAKTLTGAGLDPNQYLDINGNLKTVSTEPIPEPKLTGNKVIDDKLKASYKTAVENRQMEQYKLATQTTPILEKKTYDYVDENGNYKTVDLTPIKFPEMTGNTVIDKKLVSAYNSSINAQINDVIKLNQAGQITQKEMIDMVNSLNAQYKKSKSVGGLKPRLKIRKLPKLKALKVKKAKKIKAPKIKAIKFLKAK